MRMGSADHLSSVMTGGNRLDGERSMVGIDWLPSRRSVPKLA